MIQGCLPFNTVDQGRLGPGNWQLDKLLSEPGGVTQALRGTLVPHKPAIAASSAETVRGGDCKNPGSPGGQYEMNEKRWG
jgi:hypothetical protein